MSRKREKVSGMGLLPRMEARPWADGKTVSYRYKPVTGKPIALGTDRVAAIRKVLDMNGASTDSGTIAELWRLYKESAYWKRLAENTRVNYAENSVALLRVFGNAPAPVIRPADVARYLRQERAGAPIVANREVALLSNLLNLAIERGDIELNPCKQVRRNPETPREEAPEVMALGDFLAWASKRGGQAAILAGMAEFAALTGNRRAEFRELHWTQVAEDVVRMKRAKQRGLERIEAVSISPALRDLLERMRAVATDARVGAVFPNTEGNPHGERGFKSAWSRLMAQAIADAVVTKRFTFHDLRAFHVTQYKARTGELADLHANKATTARVYDRTKEVKRNSL